MRGFEVFCDLWDVAVVNVSAISVDEFVGPLSVYGSKGSREKWKKPDA